MRGEFEKQMQELFEEERLKIQEDSQQALIAALQEAKEEAEMLFNERVSELKEQYHGQIDLEKDLIRIQCMEELRSEKELQIQAKLRDKITKKIENEVLTTLPKAMEERLRGQVEEKIANELQESNMK